MLFVIEVAYNMNKHSTETNGHIQLGDNFEYRTIQIFSGGY